MRVLVIGASGMLGSMVFRFLAQNKGYQVFGSVRDSYWCSFFPPLLKSQLISGIDVLSMDALTTLFYQVKPDLVINCVGVTKHKPNAEDSLVSISINSLLPHHLANLSKLLGARMIHISTDCIFSGKCGSYRESDISDATDLYGRSKFLGEVEYSHTITLRTSIIGHELQSKYGLLEWFLQQNKICDGYSEAIFSGFPTVVLAQIICDYVIPHNELSGVYHVSANPINKFELLNLIAHTYKKEIEIIKNDVFRIDRSLNSDRFRSATGYEAPAWPELINTMHAYK